MPLQVYGGDWLSMVAAKRSAGVHLYKIQIRLPTLALKHRGYITRHQKTGVSVAPQKGLLQNLKYIYALSFIAVLMTYKTLKFLKVLIAARSYCERSVTDPTFTMNGKQYSVLFLNYSRT